MKKKIVILEHFLLRLAQKNALIICFYRIFCAKPVPTFAKISLVLYLLFSCVGHAQTKIQSVSLEEFLSEHWVINCDNRGYCTALGFPYDEESVFDDGYWYIKITWHKNDKRNLAIFLNSYMDYNNEISGYGNFQACEIDARCKDIIPSYLKKDKYKYIYEIYIDYNDLTSFDYITMSKLESKNKNLYLDEFKKFIINQNKEEFLDLPIIGAVSWKRKDNIPIDQVKKILRSDKDFSIDDWRDESCANEKGVDTVFDFKDSNKIYVICISTGYNSFYYLYKRYNDNYIPLLYPFEYNSEMLDDSIQSNEFTNFRPLEGSQYIFTTIFLSNAPGGSGERVKMIFDGQNFRVIEVATMPLKMGIDSDDWPITYSMPHRLQENVAP